MESNELRKDDAEELGDEVIGGVVFAVRVKMTGESSKLSSNELSCMPTSASSGILLLLEVVVNGKRGLPSVVTEGGVD